MTTPTRLGGTTWAWLVVAGLSVLLLVAAAVVGAQLNEDGTVAGAWSVLLLGWPVMGGLLVARRPANVVGRLLVAIGASFAVSIAAEEYVVVSRATGGLPASDLAAWLSGAFAVAIALVTPLIAVFPSGRVASAWLRWPLGLWAVAAVVGVSLRMLVPGEIAAGIANPWGVEALASLVGVDFVLFYVVEAVMVLAFVDLVLRWRRSRGVERLQMRWLAMVLAVFAFLLVISSALRIPGPSDDVLQVADTVAWLSGLGAFPVAIGVAVGRYRLYEVDRLLSRTVAYTLIVAVLAALYAGGVFVLRGLLPAGTDLAVAASTVAVAALFNPLRTRVLRRVDHRFNRPRYDAALELQRFAGRVRSHVDLDELTGDMSAVVGRTVQPSTISLWLRG